MNTEQAQIFVLPEGKDIPSGGHRYNRLLLAALAELGISYQRQTLSEWDQTEWKEGGIYWFDSLDLPSLPKTRHWPFCQSTSILIVHHLISLFPPEGAPNTWFKQHELPLLQEFDGFLVTSKFTENYLLQQGIPKKKILTAPPGLEMKIPKQRTYSPGIQAVLVGNILPRKGILPLLDALDGGLAKESTFQLKIIGSTTADPDYAQRCMRRIEGATFLKERVTVLGSLSFEEVCVAYQEANLFLSASGMETYGMAIQEAAASGLPLLLQAGGYSGQHLASTGKGSLVDGLTALVTQINEWEKQAQAWLTLQAEAWQERPHYPTWRESAQDLLQQLRSFINQA